MSDEAKLHRGHLALLGYIKDGEPRAAYPRNGTVEIDGIGQDFLTGWYEQLKAWSLISAEDLLGRTGNKLGETIRITEEGAAKLRQAEAVS
jgi:hypothetical protein